MSELAMGIDLGTSYSCVSIIENGAPIVLPSQSGDSIQASVISFTEDDKVVVGNDAKKMMVTNPEHTIFSVKRLIGRFFFADEVRKARSLMPYVIAEGPNHSVQIHAQDKVFFCAEISAFVLQKMKRIVEDHVGQEVTRAVITVPAYFNDNQRQATKEAGVIAGLDVLRIINEPTAAALSYGFGKGYHQRVAVYDLGGGTFDVSILDIGDDVFEVVSTAGDTYLGGDDFDDRIMDWLTDCFEQQHAVELRGDHTAEQTLRAAAEDAKIRLSTHEHVEINLPDLYTDPFGNDHDFSANLSRVEFNQMVMDLVQRTFKVCDEALHSAQLTASDIDCVILVGGPTRLPIIRSCVQHYFQKPPLTDIHPDQVVAMGAAIQANTLVSSQQSTYLLDVTPLTLRLGTVGGYTEKIIEKNTPVPIDQTKLFSTASDHQERVRIRIYQGESNLASENVFLGEFEFTGFRVALRGEVTIEVTFEIDTDGLVNVRAHDVETGARSGLTINLSSGLADHELRDAQDRNQQLSARAS